MKHLEIISVRAFGCSEQEACRYLKTSCREAGDPRLLGADFYSNAFVPGDHAVILSWHAELPTNQKTDVGVILANTLRHFSLVNHAFWVMSEG
jgi:hypothetical protein